ncbi:DUF418 domain-containing protein [Streptomyces thermoviolaceus subsp. thermoviolaceus]|uniref:DUF418 domain-containing protein n=2 Tax=Streptomyces thermoviolaceus TaxID=1952 RepID=A0ABX0YPR1_STRTL|nr:DUF418 domain-containing protein [Streptomyces thermoviolaceus subsp. thermoviolaceus]
MVNAPVLAGASDLGTQPGAPLADHVAAWLVTALFTTKFYLIFSFLFGYSFTLQMRAAERDHVPFASRHGRRLLGLFLLGLAHAVLLYAGDILMTYAVLGLVLFAVRGLRARTALRAAALLVVFLAAVFLAVGVFVLTLHAPERSAAGVSAAREAAAFRGGPLSVVQANVRAYRDTLGGAILYSAHLFAAFLVGLAAGRHRLLERLDEPTQRTRLVIRRLLRTGVLAGVPGGVFTAMCAYGPLDSRLYYLGQAVDLLTAPALATAYVCAVVTLLQGRFGPRLRRALAPAGRMSLSNYLSQSLVLALIFTGYGLGLYGRVGPAALVAVCLGLYAAQLAFSAWLMARSRYGPAELLLRRITLGRHAWRTARGLVPHREG